MRATWIIAKRELAGYFITPVAYVFLFFFLVLTGLLTFQLGGFLDSQQADMRIFFGFHPLLYLFLIPAISMRLWSEERRQGTIELLMTLPVPIAAAVVGKFLASWLFAGIALVLTFPIWMTVNELGDPDNGVIAASYLGSFLMAGGYLAIGACVSATTKNQVIAFVVSICICLLFLLFGLPDVTRMFSWAGPTVIDTLGFFSFQNRFASISKGVLDSRDVIFFVSLIAFWLFANTLVIERKKAN